MLRFKPTIHIIALPVLLASTISHSQEDTTNTGGSDTTSVQEKPSMAENEGIVRFLVDVDNGYFEVLINDTLFLRRYKDTLPEGTYEAKVWSPGYVTNPIEFTIERGKVTDKFVNMVYTNDKQDFERKYKAYRLKFHKSFTVPASIALASSLFTGFSMMKAYDIRKKADIEIALYGQSPDASQVAQIKLNVADLNKKYNIYRTCFYVSSGLSVLMWVTTAITYQRFKNNNEEPTFNPSSPWRDKFSMTVTPFGCSMVLKI